VGWWWLLLLFLPASLFLANRLSKHLGLLLALFLTSYFLEGGGALPINLTLLFLLLAVFAFHRRQYRKGRYPLQRPGWGEAALLLFTAFYLCTSLWADSTGSALFKAGRMAVTVILPYCLIRFGRLEQQEVSSFLQATLLILWLNAMITVGGFLLQTSLPGTRFTLFSINPIGQSMVMIVGAGLFATALRYGKTLEQSPWLHSRPVLLTGLLGCLLALLSSGSRGPLAALFAVVALRFLLNLRRSPLRVLGTTVLVGLILGLVWGLWQDALMERFFVFERFKDFDPKTLLELQKTVDTNVLMANSTAVRFYIYAANFNLFLEYPLFGAGAAASLAATFYKTYPHNMILELLAESGVVGLGLFLIFWWWWRQELGRRLREEPDEDLAGLRRGLAFTVLALLLAKQFSYDMTMHKDIFILAALAVAKWRSEETVGHQRRDTTSMLRDADAGPQPENAISKRDTTILG